MTAPLDDDAVAALALVALQVGSVRAKSGGVFVTGTDGQAVFARLLAHAAAPEHRADAEQRILAAIVEGVQSQAAMIAEFRESGRTG